MAESSGAVRTGHFGGEPAVTLAAGTLEATFLPALGLLGVSLRHRGDELLALPGGLRAYGAGHLTGLPLLAPWANRLGAWRYQAAGAEVDLTGLALHTDQNGLPSHGTMTAQQGWGIVALDADGPRLEARFDYGARADLLAAFPFPHELAVEVTVAGDSLTLTTTLRPTAERAVPVSFGWHPYLRLPGAPRRSWKLRLPERRHVVLDHRGLPTGSVEEQAAESGPLGRRTFDDHYALGDDRRFCLEGGGRRITVSFEQGYGHAQLYVPPGKPFVCVEPMTAPVNALVSGQCRLVGPGTTYAARFSVVVQ